MELILNVLKKYWYLFLGVFLFIIIVLSQLWMFYYFNNKNSNILTEEIVMIDKEEDVDEEIKEEYLYVDIKGKVKKPGVYKLPLESRVKDAINAAGGLLDVADTSVINLSLKLVDEMVIVIYSRDEVNNFKDVKKEENLIVDGCNNDEKIENDSCINKDSKNTEDKNDGKVSINNANVEELMQLPGVGESKAKSIVEYRQKNGNFEKLDDLLNVSGIGEKLFEDIKEYISL